jgi:hypothetical protein
MEAPIRLLLLLLNVPASLVPAGFWHLRRGEGREGGMVSEADGGDSKNSRKTAGGGSRGDGDRPLSSLSSLSSLSPLPSLSSLSSLSIFAPPAAWKGRGEEGGGHEEGGGGKDGTDGTDGTNGTTSINRAGYIEMARRTAQHLQRYFGEAVLSHTEAQEARHAREEAQQAAQEEKKRWNNAVAPNTTQQQQQQQQNVSGDSSDAFKNISVTSTSPPYSPSRDTRLDTRRETSKDRDERGWGGGGGERVAGVLSNRALPRALPFSPKLLSTKQGRKTGAAPVPPASSFSPFDPFEHRRKYMRALNGRHTLQSIHGDSSLEVITSLLALLVDNSKAGGGAGVGGARGGAGRTGRHGDTDRGKETRETREAREGQEKEQDEIAWVNAVVCEFLCLRAKSSSHVRALLRTPEVRVIVIITLVLLPREYISHIQCSDICTLLEVRVKLYFLHRPAET